MPPAINTRFPAIVVAVPAARATRIRPTNRIAPSADVETGRFDSVGATAMAPATINLVIEREFRFQIMLTSHAERPIRRRPWNQR
jgi:hypothetical protein